jgi:hypothetical protein
MADATAAAKALHAEVERRNEWYGLDNWSFNEVVDFVLKAAGVEANPSEYEHSF